MPNLFTVEELVIDDSFYCYCLNAADDQNIHTRWQQYAADNPSEKQHIEEARLIVLGLHSMLQQRKSASPLHFTTASQTSYTVNSLLMACTLYSSRIAFTIIGFCITALLAVYSIPVLQSATQPGLFRPAPAANGNSIAVMQQPLSPASARHFRQTLLFRPDIAPFACKLPGIAAPPHNNSFYYKQTFQGKAALY